MKNSIRLLASCLIILCFTACKKKEKLGSVNITVSFSTSDGCLRTMEVGLGHSSDDTQNEAYFERGSSTTSPFTYSSSQLKAGTYYYKANASSGVVVYSRCKTPSTKSGSFTIKEGEATEINVQL